MWLESFVSNEKQVTVTLTTVNFVYLNIIRQFWQLLVSPEEKRMNVSDLQAETPPIVTVVPASWR
jgi:hypothetical protein